MHPLIAQDIERVAAAVGERLYALQGKRLLLTGAGGYLASYLAETILWANDHLFATPCRLLALVRQPVTPDGRLGHLLGRSDVEWIIGDAAQPQPITGNVHFIVHAASKASPRAYLSAPLDTMNTNVEGTRWLLELARERDAESFLYFSSGEIYGDATLVPTPETYPGSADPLHPRACYTESKRYAEALIGAYHREYGIRAKIVRPFHVYGPGLRLDDGRVMADFLRSRLENQPIHLLSDGSGERAFCYLADATIGFWSALLSDHHGEAFNIGDDRELISIRKLAEMLARLYEPVLETHFADQLPEHLRGTPGRTCPDMTKARHLLGYVPQTDLREGVMRTLDWYRSL